MFSHSSRTLLFLMPHPVNGIRFDQILELPEHERTEGLFARFTVLAVNSVKAAVSASASRALKKTRYFGGDTLRSSLTA